ncbi:MAG: amidase [Caldilineales bacterium]|nr:amidase [Caldilineales bacterium]
MSNSNAQPAEIQPESQAIEPIDIATAARLIGLEFTAAEIDLMLDEVDERRKSYEALRNMPIANSIAPALQFQVSAPPSHLSLASEQPPAPIQIPNDETTLALMPMSELSYLIHTRQISSFALTELYLDRLQRFDPLLECTITLTAELALDQAKRADAELAAGRVRGPLHGIPWGAKDLLAVRGYPTTWGAAPFKDQRIDADATVVQKLEQAGAVLAAKLSLGALAWGDVWFGGKTRSPWNTDEGSSGSSAGPGAATAAGLVGFSIGSETWGSIVSPSTACGVTGLRPTFGRVSRHGAMALSWSMDKLGPMCRSVEDCALVFAAIHGSDGLDPAARDYPFLWPVELDMAGLRIGYVANAFDQDYNGRENDLQTLETLRSLGLNLIPISLPDYPIPALGFILMVEAAAAFDELTRSGRDDLLVRQVKDAWPNVFRQARLIPAVEYVQANRVRSMLMAAMAELFKDIDLYVAPSLAGDNLLLTNLTGHPSLTLPNGMGDKNLPNSFTFTGGLFDESRLLAVAQLYQQATDFHRRLPAGLSSAA